MFQQQVLYPRHSIGASHHRIPALLRSPAGTVLAFHESRVNSSSDHGAIDLVLARSTDGGQTWNDSQVLFTSPHEEEVTWGNPCPVADANGRLHLLFCRNNQRAFHATSDDDGLNWSEPVELTDFCRKNFDFEWGRIATGPVHGLCARDGRLVIPVWINDEIGRDRTFYSATLVSTDHGETWQTSNLPGRNIDIHNTNECVAAQRADGTLVLNMRSIDADCRILAESTDGLNWTNVRKEPALPDGHCQASLIALPDDGSGNERMLFANPPHAAPEDSFVEISVRRDLTVRLSLDGGRTWPHSRKVCETFTGYCDLAVLPDETCLLLYENGTEEYNEQLTLARFDLDWLLGSD